MDLVLYPGRLKGAVTPPPSKSQAHRAAIAAALAKGRSKVYPFARSEDIVATLSAMETLGARFDPVQSVIEGIAEPKKGLPVLDCGESGSTLRFLLPVALALCGGGSFRGRGRLMERPQEPYLQIFREQGMVYSRSPGRFAVQGTLNPGVFRLRGDVSSQFVSGLLFALPLLPRDSEIVLTTPLESRAYVSLTLSTLSAFGIQVENQDFSRFAVPGAQAYRPGEVRIESDYSQAAFFAVANALGSGVAILGLRKESAQGDKAIFDIIRQLSSPGSQEVDVSQCPDLAPAAALLAALRDGEETFIVNAARLRAKESDRLRSIACQLNRLGAKVEEREDFLRIAGVSVLRGGAADSCGDHRIAMMLAIAATRSAEPVFLAGAECVRKSYPDFWKEYADLGGRMESCPER